MIRKDMDNAILTGVCSGLGREFGVDPIIIRLLFVIAVLGYGVGLLPYFILWLLMPED